MIWMSTLYAQSSKWSIESLATQKCFTNSLIYGICCLEKLCRKQFSCILLSRKDKTFDLLLQRENPRRDRQITVSVKKIVLLLTAVERSTNGLCLCVCVCELMRIHVCLYTYVSMHVRFNSLVWFFHKRIFRCTKMMSVNQLPDIRFIFAFFNIFDKYVKSYVKSLKNAYAINALV